VKARSFYEAPARERARAILDPDSFRELLPPEERVTSPHLPALDMPVAFDDGVVVGSGSLAGQTVLVAAQEGRFMGGAVGEVHGAKVTGLLRRALAVRPSSVLLLLESGGVRLQEANAGLVAISEIMRAVLAVRAASIPVFTAVGGPFGCFGGMGIVASCSTGVVMNEEGRLGLSGPEVIETTRGVEEFDSRDRALVWRTMGAKHRYLLGDCDLLVEDDVAAFRAAFLQMSAGHRRPLSLEELEREHHRLERRLERFGDCRDGFDVWRALGVAEPERIPDQPIAEFLRRIPGTEGAA
jgi:malonate decarboxylase beta subunit